MPTATLHRWSEIETEQLNPLLTRQFVTGAQAKSLGLVDELGGFQQAVDRAKGILMKLKNLTEDEAYVLLRSTAMREKKKIGEIAQSILTASELLK